MKSLKITLLLAVFCIALMGVSFSKEGKTVQTEEPRSFDINDNEYDIATDLKKAKKPDNQA